MDFIEKLRSFAFLENLSRDFEILCTHLYSTAGFYGHGLFSKGDSTIAVYKIGNEFIANYRNPLIKVASEDITDTYGEKHIIDFIDDFLRIRFSALLEEATEFNVYES